MVVLANSTKLKHGTKLGRTLCYGWLLKAPPTQSPLVYSFLCHILSTRTVWRVTNSPAPPPPVLVVQTAVGLMRRFVLRKVAHSQFCALSILDGVTLGGGQQAR